METSPLLSWTLQNEIPIPDDVAQLLVEGEQTVAAFKTFRDSAIFTAKRLVVRDAQGVIGNTPVAHPESLPGQCVAIHAAADPRVAAARITGYQTWSHRFRASDVRYWRGGPVGMDGEAHPDLLGGTF